MGRIRWLDDNRTEVATRYANAAARMKKELLAGGGEKKALGELNPWRKRGRLQEMVDWMGGFDSAGTLVEEWVVMRPFVRVMQTEGRGERRVGGPPPGWMRVWLPMVSIWERDRLTREQRVIGLSGVLQQVYTRERLAEHVEREAPFRRFLGGGR